MNNKRRPILGSERGLTLIELLAVIVILGIIAAIAVPAIGGLIEKSKTQAFVSNAYAVKDASVYYLKEHLLHGGEERTEVSYRELIAGGYLEEIQDPDTGKRWDADGNLSYAAVEGEQVTGICLIGEKRKLCSRYDGENLADGPAPAGALDPELVTER